MRLFKLPHFGLGSTKPYKPDPSTSDLTDTKRQNHGTARPKKSHGLDVADRAEPKSRLPAPAALQDLPVSGPSLLARVTQSAKQCGPGPNCFDANIVQELLRRDAPKLESAADLEASPVERALESILADEVIQRMPAHLSQPIQLLGHIAAELIDGTDARRRGAWTQALCQDLKREYPRPWSSKTPIAGLLCATDRPLADKTDALLNYLRQPHASGYDTLVSMTLVRSFYLGAAREGMVERDMPFVSQATNFYVQNMLTLTGRIYTPWGGQQPQHQGVGITGYAAPSPIDATWMQPGTLATHLYTPNMEVPQVLQGLRYGNPYGVGISGSTNLFLFAADFYNRAGIAQIDLPALVTGMATLLCYDGGHSFHEVYAAANMYAKLQKLPTPIVPDYQMGHARSTFIEAADRNGDWLAQKSFTRLADFLIATDSQ